MRGVRQGSELSLRKTGKEAGAGDSVAQSARDAELAGALDDKSRGPHLRARAPQGPRGAGYFESLHGALCPSPRGWRATRALNCCKRVLSALISPLAAGRG